jgi:hypothetical protein
MQAMKLLWVYAIAKFRGREKWQLLPFPVLKFKLFVKSNFRLICLEKT